MTKQQADIKSFTVRTGGRKLTYVIRPRKRFSGLLKFLIAVFGGQVVLWPGLAAAQSVGANALPTGGSVQAGSATIGQAGNAMTVNQTSSKVIINYTTFNIGSSASVTFNQPSSSSVALNQVVGSAEASQILGRLSSNGQVWLQNAAGVYFGKGATVDVGGMLATSLKVNNDQFMNGNSISMENTGGAGKVVNEGTITARQGGYVALIAPSVANSGVINAPMGTVRMSAGDKVSVDLAGDGLIKLNIDKAAADAVVTNAGVISANGGTVVLSARSAGDLASLVVNNTGIIEANTIAERGGKIFLDGGTRGIVENSGSLLAKGADAGTKGGQVQMAGEKVGITGSSRIDVSGDAGGGTALIGGDYLGQGTASIIDGSAVANAQVVAMTADARIDASAAGSGDGGTVILYADGITRVAGAIAANGGGAGGNGGFVETSGRRALELRDGARVTAAAPAGRAGTWLLDPQDVEITAAPTANADVSGSIYSNDGGAAKTNILALDIETALRNGTSVTVLANGASGSGGSGNITVMENIRLTSGPIPAATLTLSAAHDVVVADGVAIAAGNGYVLGVTLTAGNNTDSAAPLAGSVLIGAKARIATGGGDVLIGGGGSGGGLAQAGAAQAAGVRIGSGAVIDSGAGSIEIRGQGSTAAPGESTGVFIAGGTLRSTTGAIRVTGSGGNALGSAGFGILITDGASVVTAGGDIRLSGQASGAGNAVGIGLINGVTVHSGSGLLDVTGIAASSAGTGIGLRMDGVAAPVQLATAATSGTARIAGSGSGAAAGNAGIHVAGAGNFAAIENARTATLEITGTAGGTSGSGIVVDGARLYNSDAGTLRVEGSGSAAGGGSDNNRGVWVTGGGWLANPGAAGALFVTGRGGDSSGRGNSGVVLGDSASAGATGFITGQGGITVVGTGGGSGADAAGIEIAGASVVNSTATAGKAFTLAGTGAAGGSTGAVGVRLVGAGPTSPIVRGAQAALVVSGRGGGTAGGGDGVLLSGGSLLTGSGGINVDGTGGSGGGANAGVHLAGGAIDGNAAPLAVTGQGGSGAGGGNAGVWLEGASRISSFGDVNRTVVLLGTGAGGPASHGVLVGGGTIANTGSGTLVVSGVGAGSAGSDGVRVSGATASLSNEALGIYQVIGTGAAGSSSNAGVSVAGGGIVRTVTRGRLDLTGLSAGGTASLGVLVSGTGSLIRSQLDGNLSLTGTSGFGTGSQGVAVTSGGAVVGQRNGLVTVTGVSRGAAGVDNAGVLVTGVASRIANTGRGAVSVSGIGGQGDGADGVRVSTGGTIATAGAAGQIVGTGGTGGGASAGVEVSGTDARIETTSEGQLAITGFGGKGGGANRGVEVGAGGTVRSANSTGALDITGIADATAANAAFTGNQGVYIAGDVSTDRGALTLTGSGGSAASGGQGVLMASGGRVRSISGGTLQVVGQGFATGTFAEGIRLDGGTVTSDGANIALTGTGGGSAGANANHGIVLTGGATLSSNLGGIFLTGHDGYTDGAGAASRDIMIGGGSNRIATTSGQLALVGTGAGGIQIGADGGGDSAVVSARTITLASPAGVQEGAGGAITATTGLVLTGRGVFNLDPGNANNNVAQLSAAIAAGTGARDAGRALLIYRDFDGFSIASQNACVSCTVAGVLTTAPVDGINVFANAVGSAPAGDENSRVTLKANGNVLQSARLVTSMLSLLQAAGGNAANFQLASSGGSPIDTGTRMTANNIDVLAGSVAGNGAGTGAVQYRDQDGFAVGTVAGGALNPFTGAAMVSDAGTSGLTVGGNLWLLADVGADAAGAAPARAADLTVAAAITRVGAAATSTLLRANRDVLVLGGSDVASTGGRMDLTIAADANAGTSPGGRVLVEGSAGDRVTLATQGGSLSIGGGAFTTNGAVTLASMAGAAGRANAGAAADSVDDGVSISQAAIATGGGAATIRGRGDTVSSSAPGHRGVTLLDSTLDTAGGALAVTGTGGTGAPSAGSAVDGGDAGVLVARSLLSTGAGDLRITGTGGSVGAAVVVTGSATLATATGNLCIDATATEKGAADLLVGGGAGTNLLAVTGPTATSQLVLIARGASGGIRLGQDAADASALVLAPRVSLVSANGVRQYTGTIARAGAALAPTAAQLYLSGAGEFLLESATNDLDTLAAAIADNGATRARLVLGEANGFVIGTVDGCVSCALTPAAVTGLTVGASAGNLVDPAPGGGQVVLNVREGQVTQAAGAFLVTSELLLRGNASFRLDAVPAGAASGNDVDVLAASLGAAGALALRDRDGLVVAAVTAPGLAGVQSAAGIVAGGDVTLRTDNPFAADGAAGGSIAVREGIRLGGAASRLTLMAGAGDIVGTGAITAPLATLANTGDVDLGNAGNDLGTVTVSTPGRVRLADANDIAIDGVAASRIDVVAGADVRIDAAGSVAMGTISGRRVHITAGQDITDANGRDNNVTATEEATLVSTRGTITTTPTPELAPAYQGIVAPVLHAYAGGVTATALGSRVSIDIWGRVGNATILLDRVPPGAVYLNGEAVGQPRAGVLANALRAWQDGTGDVSMLPPLTPADFFGADAFDGDSVRDLLEYVSTDGIADHGTTVRVRDGGMRLPPGVAPLVSGVAPLAPAAGAAMRLAPVPLNVDLPGDALPASRAEERSLVRLPAPTAFDAPASGATDPRLRGLLRQLASALPEEYRRRWGLGDAAPGAGPVAGPGANF